jgi:hypothetical protein
MRLDFVGVDPDNPADQCPAVFTRMIAPFPRLSRPPIPAGNRGGHSISDRALLPKRKAVIV